MAVGDILQMTLRQKWDPTNEPMLNMFFYKCLDALGTAGGLRSEFDDTANVTAHINNIQGHRVSNDSIRTINLFDLGDFEDVGIIGSGAIDAEGLPIHSAINYTLKVDTRAVRPGSKRFSGICESMQAEGVISNSTMLAAMEVLRLDLSMVLGVPETGAYQPVVVKRIRNEPDVDHDNVWYSLPTTALEAVIGNVVTATTSPVIHHQVSRGNGR